ncbi:MAG: tyrosine-protein phosphatase [Pseudonocardia sp.]
MSVDPYRADPFRADLPTFTNFRDVGGLRTVDGRALRSGVLFRSDSVQDITEAEAEILVDKLGLRYLIDLRTGPEAVQQGRGPLANLPVGYLNIPLVDVDGPKGPPGRVLLDFYLDHLERDPNLPVAVETVAHAVRHPTLVHCAAGKDRTGMTILLVELLCGVTVADATADFLVTRTNMAAIRTRLRGWPRYADNMARLSAEIYECEQHTIDGLVDELRRRYGTAAGWARAKGLPDESVALLRRRLIEG